MGASIYGLGTMLYIDIENDDDIFGHDGQSTPPINTAIRINPKTGDELIILETGHPDLATRIASDWVFIETGKSDTLLFTMLTGKISNILFIGLIAISILNIGTGIWRRKRKMLPINN
jgi:hypothetical protein